MNNITENDTNKTVNPEEKPETVNAVQSEETTDGSGIGNDKDKKTKAPMTRKKKIIIGVCSACGVIILAAAIIIGIALNEARTIVAGVQNEIPESYDLSIKDVDGYINILLLGVDSRNMDDITGTRSDLIMLASINKDTNDVKLTSIYRDTFLKLGDTYTYDKITHGCAYGGPELTIKSLNQALDLNISTYVLVNFKAVADAVDAVGGIDVVVEDYEIQQLNKYTKQTAKNIGKTDYKLVKEPGFQTLEGVQAVSYGRIRKGVGDDFKRTERMRTVVNKVLGKVKKMSFTDVRKIIDVVTPSVKTNLSFDDVLGLAFRLPSYNIISGKGWPYEVGMGNINGTSYVFPADLYNNVVDLHKEVFGKEDYEPSPMVSEISSGILYRRGTATTIEYLPEEEPVPQELPALQEEEKPSENPSSGSGDSTGGGSGSSTVPGDGSGSSDNTGGSGTAPGDGTESGDSTGDGSGSGSGDNTGGSGTNPGDGSGSDDNTGGGSDNSGGSSDGQQPGGESGGTTEGGQGGQEGGTQTNP